MSDPGSRDENAPKARPLRHPRRTRALRAAVKAPGPAAARALAEPSLRRRRGHTGALQSAWRRLSTGTNHIVNFGLWRAGTRRAALRVNRSGDTRWHRPYTEVPGGCSAAGQTL
jgi:hypothetical protein